MKSIGKSKDNRDMYMLWTWTEDFKLVNVEVWKNTNNDAYWVPSLGWTGSLNTNLFEDKQDAYLKASEAIIKLEQSLNQKKKNLKI